jgi:predicted Zn-dependent protease
MKRRVPRAVAALLAVWLLAAAGILSASAGSAGDSRRTLPLRMIVVPTQQEAREIAAAAAAGTPFERLARERSIGPERERGGYLGRVNPATLSPDAQAALSRTRVGQVSPVFSTEQGYALFQWLPEPTARALDQAARNELEGERLLEEGTEAGKAGELRRAAELLARAAELHPTLLDAHYNLAIAHRRLGQMPEAMTAMRRAIELRPDDYDARMRLGGWLHETGQHAEASLQLERAAMLRMDSPEAWNRLAQCYEAAGRSRDAAAAYRRVLALLGRDDPALLQAILRNAMAGRDGPAALDAARRLQPLSPGHQGFVAVGQALLLSGEAERAAAELEKAVALSPSSVPGRLALSEAYSALGKPAAAAAELAQVTRLEPDNPAHYQLLSQRYDEAGRLDLAIVSLRDGLSVAGKASRQVQAEIASQLATYYERAGMKREAAREWSRAEALQAPAR